ncbi:MAG: matrixin family metalloprotease [Candidatus Paceibacterota bacterium]
MIRNVINWLVLAVVLVVAGATVYERYEATRPCAAPVHYAIGAVDPRFEISKDAVLASTKEAIAIWNTAAGRTVLAYDPAAALKINLVYDERAATSKLGAEIAAKQAAADSERATLNAQQEQYTIVQTDYNAKVAAIHARGGATRKEAAQLELERKALDALGPALEAQVRSYNARLATLNAAVEEYNKAAGRTFEEGQFVRDAQGERINVFQFSSATQLKRVLAHEFGHALSLPHNDDSDAIMYAKNESGNLAPTAADLEGLKEVCGGVK